MAVSIGRTRQLVRSVGESPRPSFGLLAAAAAVAAWSCLPLIAIAVAWFQVGPQGLSTMLLRPRMVELLWSTASLIGLVLPLCVTIGVSAAWIVERTAVPGRRALAILLAAPMAIPAFVNSF